MTLVGKKFYPTASTATVFLNGFHIDQAYRVDFRDSVPKIPIYGYNDYTYTKVVRGQGIVQGMLVTNFTYPGYLAEALRNAGGKTTNGLYNLNSENDRVVDRVKKELRSELPPNTPEGRAARADYIATLLARQKQFSVEKGRFHTDKELTTRKLKAVVSDFFTKPNTSTVDATENDRIERNPLFIGSDQNDTLEIYYHDPSLALFYVKFENIHFTEISQQISQAGAEGSSEPLYEIAQFISSKRTVIFVGSTTN